jgi:sec-independent protein translocase protein TatA
MGLDNPLHIAFLLILLLLVFGAKRLPEIGQSLGSGLRGFKRSLSGEDEPAALGSTPQPQPALIAQPQPTLAAQSQPALIAQPQPAVAAQPQPQPALVAQSQPAVAARPDSGAGSTPAA